MGSAVIGTGVCLPSARSLAELYTCISLGRPLQGRPEGFWAPYTDLEPVEATVARCLDPQQPPGLATRLRKLPRESRLATSAAAEALADCAPAAAGCVWVSSTAGMEEYGQICVDAATLDPGLASPLAGPQSGYNGPAGAVSIQFGLTGPQLTLTGGYEAGANAFVEASRMLDEGRCDQVLVGGSATVSRWRLVGGDRDTIPAEGAICLLLGRRGGVTATPLRRSRIQVSKLPQFVAGCLAEISRPPQAVALSMSTAWRAPVRQALGATGAPQWPVERATGDLGAAGGLQAVLAGVAACGWPAAGLSSVLVLAIGDAGDAVAVEVLSKKER